MKNIIVFLLFGAAAITFVALALIPQIIIPEIDNYAGPIAVKNKPLKAPVKNICDANSYGMDCFLTTYLEENAAIKSHDGKNFCAYDKLNKDNGQLAYLYILCDEFYLANDKIYQGSGTAGPAKISEDGNARLSLWRPRDGNLFSSDLSQNFPAEILPQVQNFDISLSEKLFHINRERAKKYFNADFDYKIEKTTEIVCANDFECQTPGEYLIQSRCPFTSMCVNNKCTVVCPSFVQNLRFGY